MLLTCLKIKKYEKINIIILLLLLVVSSAYASEYTSAIQNTLKELEIKCTEGYFDSCVKYEKFYHDIKYIYNDP